MHTKVPAILFNIGEPRIAPYRTFFRCKSDIELLGAYFWGQAVGAAFQPALGMYEVTVRNAIHFSSSQFASRNTETSHNWYDRKEQYALPIRGKTAQKVADILYSGEPPVRRAPEPTPDAVVASLSFGFWPSFLDGLTQREQPRILTDTFRFHPHSKPKHWSQSENVVNLIGMLKSIQELRNAVAHLEPIWKPHRLTGSETHWSHSVKSLREKYEEILLIMSWCSPETALVMQNCYSSRVLKRICSTDAVKAYMSDPFGAGDMVEFTSPKAALP